MRISHHLALKIEINVAFTERKCTSILDIYYIITGSWLKNG